MTPERHQPVRQPLFDGRRPVRALWFDLPLLGEAEARRRVLAHWENGARLFAVDGGYLLEWTTARWHDVKALDGLALCEVGHVMSSAPLAPAELAQLKPGAWWLVRGAQAQAAVAQARLDPSAWLDLRAIALREPLSPAVPATRTGSLVETRAALSDILGAAMPASSARRDAFLRAAQQPVMPRGAAAAAAAVGVGAVGLLGGLLAALLPRGGGSNPGSNPGSQPGNGPAPTGGLARLAARLAMFTRVSRLLGWRQANYLRSMLDMFDKGDVDAALRHAIALGGEQPGDRRPLLGTPNARNRLDVTTPRAGGAAIGLDATLEQHLRTTYRRTFEQLDRAGRIDEAVFVLAELLRCGAEAVTYLETKGRYMQAAQLAATLELAAELRVRLWLLAGEPARAIALARLHNSFADVVRQLDKTQSAHAGALRREWALHLAAGGHLAEAVDAIWPLQEERDLARTWLVAAQHAGGALGVRALARSLALLPDALAAHAPAVTALLEASGADGVQLRARLATELLALTEQTAATRRVGTALARHVIAERQQGMNGLDHNALTKLVDLGGSAMLRADLPTLKLPSRPRDAPLAARSTVLALTLAERALLPIHDAVRLPDGHYLLALGEGGAVRINARGKQVAHYPVPAFHLVPSDGGQHALALAQRNDTYRVSRIDLLGGKVADWLTLPLRFWSERYDGVTWNVVLEGRLVAIDTTAPRLSITWQVTDLPGAIVGYNDAGPFQGLLLALPDNSIEQWSYAQPGRQLRQRDAWECGDDRHVLLPSAAGGAPWRVDVASDARVTNLLLTRHAGAGQVALTFNGERKLEVQSRHGWWLIAAQGVDDSECRIVTADGITKASITLAQADQPRVRMQGDRFVAFDRAGRLVDIGSKDGEIKTLLLS